MRTRPRGYRASAVTSSENGRESLLVTGSVVDFTAASDSSEPKIVLNHCNAVKTELWHEVAFELRLGVGVAVTEILVLPPAVGSVLWRFLDVRRKPQLISQPNNTLTKSD